MQMSNKLGGSDLKKTTTKKQNRIIMDTVFDVLVLFKPYPDVFLIFFKLLCISLTMSFVLLNSEKKPSWGIVFQTFILLLSGSFLLSHSLLFLALLLAF